MLNCRFEIANMRPRIFRRNSSNGWRYWPYGLVPIECCMDRTNSMNWNSVYKLVKQIPRGRIATYGQIARMLKLPGGARAAGRAMAACPSGRGIPWHRVVGADGRLLLREPNISLQRKLLGSVGFRLRAECRRALAEALDASATWEPTGIKMNTAVIEVENLTKRYGDVEALRGVSFSVSEGEVFGLLGPNGAGKTSTVEILEGLRTPDSGRVSVCGLDPQRSGAEFKQVIGAALQSTALPDKMRVREALDLFGSFYPRRRGTAELLERFGLEEKRNAFYSQLSGGQKQRLALAMALVNNPRVVFLDEPTAGLDPQVRREIYDIIEELKREKKTIVMTTHYIKKAERLCDRVAIVNHGKVVALGTPRELKSHSGGTTRIEVRLSKPEPDGALKSLEGVADARELDGAYVIHSHRPPQTIVAIVKHLEAQGNELVRLHIASPSLEAF